MKQSTKQSIAALLLAGSALAAVAQTAPAPARPAQEQRMERHDPARMQQVRQERRAKRMERLKEALRITPAQEGAWSAFTASRQPPANWKRLDRAELARLSTPERIDRMRAHRTERIAMRDRRGDATKVFYAALDVTQKRVFDLATARGDGRGRGHHGGYHRGHHGMMGR